MIKGLNTKFRNGSTLAALSMLLCACVFRIDVQQGNLLEEDVVEQVEVGMTRSQVQFLLGTPMISDAFHDDRWDYAYYFKAGRSKDVERRWLIVFFREDRVVRLDQNVVVNPSG